MTQAVDEEPVMVCSSKAVPSNGGEASMCMASNVCLVIFQNSIATVAPSCHDKLLDASKEDQCCGLLLC